MAEVRTSCPKIYASILLEYRVALEGSRLVGELLGLKQCNDEHVERDLGHRKQAKDVVRPYR